MGDFPFMLMSNHEVPPRESDESASQPAESDERARQPAAAAAAGAQVDDKLRGEGKWVFFILVQTPRTGTRVKTLAELKHNGHQEKGR